MGDRCYLMLTLNGHIETLDQLNEIAKMFAERFDENSADRVVEKIAYAVATGFNPSFEMHECNYANIDDEETLLQICKMAYSVRHEAGGDYPGGRWFWSPEDGRFEAIDADGECVLMLSQLKFALAKDDPLAEIKELVANADRAGGPGKPTFSVSDEVKVHLAKIVACQVLKVA